MARLKTNTPLVGGNRHSSTPSMPAKKVIICAYSSHFNVSDSWIYLSVFCWINCAVISYSHICEEEIPAWAESVEGDSILSRADGAAAQKVAICKIGKLR